MKLNIQCDNCDCNYQTDTITSHCPNCNCTNTLK